MKLARFGKAGEERPGLLTPAGERIDLSHRFSDWDSKFFTDSGVHKLNGMLGELSEFPRVGVDIRIGPPIARPGKIICVGLNYRDHAAESGMPIPVEPILFMKAPNTVVGPNDVIELPKGSTKVDWEVELGVVIGKQTRHLEDVAQAGEHIAGYLISHDVSERAFQLERGGQWVKGKSCDTFNPLGPFLLTADELPDPQCLGMSLDVNGMRRQTGNTSTMIFSVFELVRYISQFMTLEPGDLINTGTPPGVGLGMSPPQYLKEGDAVELAIDRLGRQRQVCVKRG